MQQLNKEQQQAVMHRDGPMLVLAGPGSGKTAVLVNRVLRLVREENIDPYNILVLTFSKLAAEEMRSRFIRLADASYPVTFGTFHAIFYHILKSQGLYRTGEILTRNKKLSLLGITARRMIPGFSDDAEKLQRLIDNISIKKMGCQRVLDELDEDEAGELELVYEPYINLCRTEGLIDFDDMINECLKALKGNTKILAKWQQRYRYILVDEFQDIDKRQYEVLRLLEGKSENLFCVGDDDQSIYSFRGAEPAVMRKFVDDHPAAALVELKLNYRCPEELISHADRLIRCNKDRFEKRQVCDSNKTGRIEYRCFRNTGDEAAYCAGIISRLTGTVGVLYRTSRSADVAEEMLKRKGIPYRRKDRSESYYDKEWVRDVMAYLKLSTSKELIYKDELFRVLNRPERGLTRESISGQGITRDTVLDYYGNDALLLRVCGKFFDDIDFISDMNCYGAVNYILKGIGLDKYIRQHYFGGRSSGEADEALNELKDRARAYKTIGGWLKAVEIETNTERYEHETSGNVCKPEKAADENRATVELMTIHGSKGLEFDNVIMIGLQEGIFPGKRCETQAQIEEERRLFYVAMTRCRKRLWMLGVRRDEYGKTESRFIREAGFNSETVGSIF